MKKRSVLKIICDYSVIFVSCILYAFTFNLFFETNRLPMGGFSGIGQILHHYFYYLTPGIVVLVLNLPLLVMGIKKQGLKLLFATVFAIAAVSFSIDGMNAVVNKLGWEYPKIDQPLLACIFGGILSGASLGIILLKNATTGGTELAARLLKYLFKGVSIGKLCLAIDVAVVCLYGIAYNKFESALYGIIAMYVSSIAMDAVIYGTKNAKLAYIISDHNDEISKALMKMELGVTVLNGQGAFTGKQKNVLLCAVKPSRITRIKAAVADMDPDAFVIVSDVREVYGEGFGVYDQNGL